MRILFTLLLAFTFSATAQEHKKERKPKGSQVTAEQIEKAKDLPGTIVIRTSMNDPKNVSVLHLNEKLAKNQRVATDAPFEQVALKGEVKELVFVPNSGKERDASSSTAAWRVGWGGGFHGGGYGYRGGFGYRGGYGYAGGYGYRGGYGYGGYGYGGGYGGYWPSYYYGGYGYPYVPYYSYYDAGYSYSVCGCPRYYCGGYGYGDLGY